MIPDTDPDAASGAPAGAPAGDEADISPLAEDNPASAAGGSGPLDAGHGLGAPPTPEADLERGRRLFTQACKFELSVAQLDQLPEPVWPEIAFAGRSNVGKSSLLNALVGQTTLARTSNTPGRTQFLNFFKLGGPGTGYLRLVDLPGYGYARVSKDKVANWTALLRAYLRGRANLRRALVLVDGRHGLKEADLQILALLDEAAVSYQIVLTKSDKTSARDRNTVWPKLLQDLRGHVPAHPRVPVTASRTGAGLEQLRAELALLASDPEA